MEERLTGIARPAVRLRVDEALGVEVRGVGAPVHCCGAFSLSGMHLKTVGRTTHVQREDVDDDDAAHLDGHDERRGIGRFGGDAMCGQCSVCVHDLAEARDGREETDRLVEGGERVLLGDSCLNTTKKINN
jgi:hypothetical protein